MIETSHPQNYMGVSKNWGTPKWMVYKGNPIRIDDLGVTPFLETPIWEIPFLGHIWILRVTVGGWKKNDKRKFPK